MITQEQLDLVAEGAGTRHTGATNSPPEDTHERELWGLAEILDFECYKYGDAPGGLTKQQVQEYLLAHKEEVLALRCDPPSMLGLAAGILDFLGDANGT